MGCCLVHMLVWAWKIRSPTRLPRRDKCTRLVGMNASSFCFWLAFTYAYVEDGDEVSGFDSSCNSCSYGWCTIWSRNGPTDVHPDRTEPDRTEYLTVKFGFLSSLSFTLDCGMYMPHYIADSAICKHKCVTQYILISSIFAEHRLRFDSISIYYQPKFISHGIYLFRLYCTAISPSK